MDRRGYRRLCSEQKMGLSVKQTDSRRVFSPLLLYDFITLLVENVLLWLAVDQLSLSLIGSKLIVSVVTVIGNYALCKYRVFKTAAHGQDQNMIRKELLPYDNQK